MFLTKEHFDLSLSALEIFEKSLDGEGRQKVAISFAKDIFEDFDEMSEVEQEGVLEMIIESMNVDMYQLN